MKNLVIIGTGETALLAYEYFSFDSDLEVCAFAVSKEYKKGEVFCAGGGDRITSC
ncbi:hypothetical protein [Helicobacter sp. MIT 05-5293]|uniref:hypothetical protein n=1 Tax=Helicobacter sp. MIT 05-5293 TaxID=1548149 RepID=UPI000B2CD596|nr:hypothetical protein [Helicobacter sp. MIT 05-5293]